MFDSYLYHVFRLLRPRQWIKNLALFAAITFGGLLRSPAALSQVFIGFVAFCFLSSSTYIINDILDYKKDKLHPFKKDRPIASGKISVMEGIIIVFFLLGGMLFLSQFISDGFLIIALLYLVLQIFYSVAFKTVVIFDILIIATGYILRVFAGEVITGFHISVWLLLTTVALSLFLAVGKRRSELTLLHSIQGVDVSEVRKSLTHYSESLLDAFSSIFATSTVIFYTMFTFLENPAGIKINVDVLLPEFLPYYLQRKWLMLTIIPVIYGLMKYLQDVYEKSEGESPERVLLSDKSLLFSVFIWVIMVIGIIYVID